MKTFTLVSLLVVAASAGLLEEHAVKFQAFKLTHGKTYKNQVEESIRFSIFRDNVKSIEEHNALYGQGLVSYQQGVNQFTDMTQEEFRSMLTLHAKPILKNTVNFIKTGVALPKSVDWRSQGQVTEVKNQGSCGSCWAFSITGSTEAAYYRKHKKLVSLSEQQLVDCAKINQGCNGGYLEGTFPYIEENGLQSEEDYAYISTDGICKYDQSKVVTKVDNFATISEDEHALLEAVATVGPVSVAIDASTLAYYQSGIISGSGCSPYYLNHGVLVVGYGEENGTKYWLVKNSWGSYWGEQGYFKLLRGKNECGVAQDNTYPIIN